MIIKGFDTRYWRAVIIKPSEWDKDYNGNPLNEDAKWKVRSAFLNKFQTMLREIGFIVLRDRKDINHGLKVHRAGHYADILMISDCGRFTVSHEMFHDNELGTTELGSIVFVVAKSSHCRGFSEVPEVARRVSEIVSKFYQNEIVKGDEEFPAIEMQGTDTTPGLNAAEEHYLPRPADESAT